MLKIINNKQKSTGKQEKNRKEKEEQEKTTDRWKYTESQLQQDKRNQKTVKERIGNQNEVETIEKDNLEIEKQKTNQKHLDSSKKKNTAQNYKYWIIDTLQNKETDDIIHPSKYWWTAAEEVNGPNNNDRARTINSKREINHTANNHNINIINRESKVEIQEDELEQYSMWILRHHISNERIIDRVSDQRGTEEELKQNKDTRVTGIRKKNVGKNSKAQEKEEINKKICPCCNKFA